MRWTVLALGGALSVMVGDTDGSLTEVSGDGVRPGLKVITGQLTAAAPK